MKADLHIHPLTHKYYFAMMDGFSEIVLDDEDKKNIRDVVDWCINERRLDCIALTDHDMIQASIYAREYVAQKNLPIQIITGAECTVHDPDIRFEQDEVHLLCLGLETLPIYNHDTSVERMIEEVKKLGGTVIMSHPIVYPESFFSYCHLLDGYEYRNSDKEPFDEGKKYVDSRVFNMKAYNNSDFHYRGEFPPADSRVLHSNEYNGDVLRRVL